VTTYAGAPSLTMQRILAGRDFSCAVLSSGDVSCFGDAGTYGYPNTTTKMFPSATLLSLGYEAGFVMTAGSFKSWGWNALGSLGSGSTPTGATYTSAQRPDLLGGTAVQLASYVNIKSGSLHGTNSLVLLSDGRVLCFGPNKNGECGSGTTTSVLVPTLARL
jgi:hypothetical protein